MYSFRSFAVEYKKAPDDEVKSIKLEFLIMIESILRVSITPPISVADIYFINEF